MIRTALVALVLAAFLNAWPFRSSAGQPATEGKESSDANKQRLVLDDMEDVSDWSSGTPVESTVTRSDQHVHQGRYSLLFANRIDQTKGETNYPVGWPRVRKDMAKAGRSDWSGYDFFECWIYADSSRASLPSSPLSIGFYHRGKKRSTQVPLGQVQLGQWTKIVIPIAKIAEPGDVQAVQWSISESEYRHGDRVDFYIDDMLLTRIVDPTITEFAVGRRILYSSDRHLAGFYRVMGSQGLDRVTVEFEIGRNDTVAARTSAPISPRGEITLAVPERLTPGEYWARLSLRGGEGKLIDRSEAAFRVIEGPF
jgi:hypothetical protein